MVKEFFADYYLYASDVTFDLENNSMQVHNNNSEPWKVTLVDTGLHTMTGGRVKRIRQYIGDETFMLTYGDGVCDVDISKLLEFHKKCGKIGTLTAISVDQRFGVLDLRDDNLVHEFAEKQEKDSSVVNGGYMVFEPAIFDYIEGDDTVFEKGPLSKLASEGQLAAFHHTGFWKCMDTQREKEQLEKLWASGNAPWKVWD